MASVAHKNSAYEAAAFILASDCESNDEFGDESILESSNSCDSEEEPSFPTTEVDILLFFFSTYKSFDLSSLF